MSARLFTSLRAPGLVNFFFFNDTATTEIYTLSLHDALPIYIAEQRETAAADCARACSGLTAKRKGGAERLATAVNALLPALGMEGGRFAVRLVQLPGTDRDSLGLPAPMAPRMPCSRSN